MSKERIIFAASLVCAVLLAAWALVSWQGDVSWSPPAAPPDNFRPSDVSAAPFLPASFSDAVEGGGSSPFTVLSDRRELPPEDLQVPTPPAGLPAPPPFDPAPDPTTPGYEAFVLRDPTARPGPKPEDLPANDVLEGLKALVAPDPPSTAPIKDPKASEVDQIITKSQGLVEGTIVEENPQQVRIRDKSGSVVAISRRDIQMLNKAKGLKSLYEERRKDVAAGDVKGQAELGQWCAERGLAAEATQAYEAAIAAGKTAGKAPDPRGYLGLADMARRDGDLDGELDACQRAAEAGVSAIEVVHVRLAGLYQLLGMPEAALRSLDAAVHAHPTYTEGKLRYGLALLAARRGDAAAEQIARGAELAASEPAAAPLAAYAQGRLLLARNDAKGAAAALAKAVPAPATSGPAAPAAGMPPLANDPGAAWRALASASAHAGASKEAGTAAVEAVRAAPDDARGWVTLGTLYLLADRVPEARTCFEEARRRDPSAATPVAALAVVTQLDATKADDALALVRQAAQIDPGDGYAHAVLGHLLLGKDDVPAAAHELSAALGLGSNTPATLFDFGLAALRQKSFGLAAGAFERIVSADTTRPVLPCAQGLALLGRGETDRAETWLRQAIRLAPGFPAAVEGLAYLDYLNRRTTEAVAKLESLLAAAPGDPYLTQAIALVKAASNRTLWEDTFDRADSEQAGKGWFKADKFGIEVALAGRRARLAGTQAVEDNGESALERVVRADTLVRFEADLDLADAGAAVVGLRLAFKTGGASRQSGLRFGRNGKGKLVSAVSVEGELAPRWREIGDAPAGPVIRLAIEKAGSDPDPAYNLLVDGKPVGTQKATLLEGGGENLTCGVFGQAAKGEKWAVAVTAFRIVEKKRKGQ